MVYIFNKIQKNKNKNKTYPNNCFLSRLYLRGPLKPSRLTNLSKMENALHLELKALGPMPVRVFRKTLISLWPPSKRCLYMYKNPEPFLLWSPPPLFTLFFAWFWMPRFDLPLNLWFWFSLVFFFLLCAFWFRRVRWWYNFLD